MIVIHDSHITRSKHGPLPVANYSVFLMASTEGKCYSVAEIESFLTEAGFKDANCADTALNHSAIVALEVISLRCLDSRTKSSALCGSTGTPSAKNSIAML